MNDQSPTESGYRAPHPMFELVKARFLEFVRQPEAVFWVYVFPILMVVALGIAFRSQPVESFSLLIEDNEHASKVTSVLESTDKSEIIFDFQTLSAAECQAKLRAGKTPLVVVHSGEQIAYRYDPTRPGSLAAKSAVDDALQVAAGRTNPLATVEQANDEPGSRYIDFLVPGLLGMGLMGGGLFGVGFAIVDLRIRKLLKLFLATPMKRTHFLSSLSLIHI